MELIVLGSSSSGNGYILKGRHKALIIECGLPAKVALKAIDYDLKSVVGAIVSHKHGDHAKYIQQYLDKGIDVYVGDDHGIKGHRLNRYHDKKTFAVGYFEVMPLEVEHDVKCHSFIIRHSEIGTMYFVTDTHYIKYRPSGINHMVVECNYDEEIMDNNIINDKINGIVRDRVLTSHLSIQNLSKWFKKVDLSPTKQIVLTHLSNVNADGNRFKKEIEMLTGKPTTIASPGITIPLTSTPF